MGNLFYEQLEKASEENDYDELRKLINKDKRRVKQLFENAFELHEDYGFYYGMYNAYNNVLTMIINITKEGKDNERN